MCGILAVWNKNLRPISEQLINECNSLMKHRGPDGNGIYIENNLGLSHSRLAIMGTEACAKQPIQSKSGDTTMAYNGEVYNFKTLFLANNNYTNNEKCNSDSRTVVEYIEQKGIEYVENFNGMFSIVAFNKKQNEIYVARDRYGTKPLYVFENEDYLILSSEIRVIVRYLKRNNFKKLKLNHQILSEYLTFQNIISDETIIEGIRVFPKASYAVINMMKKDVMMRPIQYWHQKREPTQIADDSESVRNLGTLIKNSCKSQTMGNAQFGFFLSGGIDSSLIALNMSKELSGFCSVTIGFENKDRRQLANFNEEHVEALKFAESLAACAHFRLLNSSDVFENIKLIARSLEEPRVGQSYPNFYAAKVASENCKVMFSGTGGDELFGGYPWRYALNYEFPNWNELIEHFFASSHKVFTKIESKTIFKKEKEFCLNERNVTLFNKHFDFFRQSEYNFENRVRSYINYDFEHFLSGLLLVEDKLGMNFGLETRFPYLDNDIVDYAQSLKMSDLLQVNRNKQLVGKLPLRDLLEFRGYPEIANREKQGFSGPDSEWFRNELREFVWIKLSGEMSIWEVIDKNQTLDIVDNYFKGNSNRSHLIWSILLLEEMIQYYEEIF